MVERQFAHQPSGAVGTTGVSVITPRNNSATEDKWINSKSFELEKRPSSGKLLRIKDDSSLTDKFILMAGEICGTATLLYLGCMGCVNGMADSDIPQEQTSLTFGFAVLIAIQVFGHVSGAHLNPAVTLGAIVLKHTALSQAPFYIAGQFLGAIFGFGLLILSTPSNLIKSESSPGICSPGISPKITIAQAFLVELIITILLVWVCCGVWDKRNARNTDSISIRFALVIAGIAMASGPYTGAHMNPARSFAPALLNGDWNYHWLYWVAPLLGGFLAALIYRLLFTKEPFGPDPDQANEAN